MRFRKLSVALVITNEVSGVRIAVTKRSVLDLHVGDGRVRDPAVGTYKQRGMSSYARSYARSYEHCARWLECVLELCGMVWRGLALRCEARARGDLLSEANV